MKHVLPVWQADWDKPHKCPRCWNTAVRTGFVSGVTYVCTRMIELPADEPSSGRPEISCMTAFRRGWLLQPYGSFKEDGKWTWKRCITSYARNRARQLTWKWRFRKIMADPPWWYAWGEEGPLVRGSALAWWHMSGLLGKIPGFTDATERIARIEARRMDEEDD